MHISNACQGKIQVPTGSLLGCICFIFHIECILRQTQKMLALNNMLFILRVIQGVLKNKIQSKNQFLKRISVNFQCNFQKNFIFAHFAVRCNFFLNVYLLPTIFADRLFPSPRYKQIWELINTLWFLFFLEITFSCTGIEKYAFFQKAENKYRK